MGGCFMYLRQELLYSGVEELCVLCSCPLIHCKGTEVAQVQPSGFCWQWLRDRQGYLLIVSVRHTLQQEIKALKHGIGGLTSFGIKNFQVCYFKLSYNHGSNYGKKVPS